MDVILGEVSTIDLRNQRITAGNIELSYDYLIVAAGARPSYFGHNEWEQYAPGLKTIKDALELRRRILVALESADSKAVAAKQSEQHNSDSSSLNFVVVGGGPTGVEIAVTLASLEHKLKKDFRAIDLGYGCGCFAARESTFQSARQAGASSSDTLFVPI